jgi:hypothetical protein
MVKELKERVLRKNRLSMQPLPRTSQALNLTQKTYSQRKLNRIHQKIMVIEASSSSHFSLHQILLRFQVQLAVFLPQVNRSLTPQMSLILSKFKSQPRTKRMMMIMILMKKRRRNYRRM